MVTDFVFSDRRNTVPAGKYIKVSDKKENKNGDWLYVDCPEKIEVEILSQEGGKASVILGELSAVTPAVLDNLQLSGAEGIIVPIPKSSSLLWNEETGITAKNVGELDDIFNEEIEESCIRGFYYEEIEKYIISGYILPVYEKAKKLGIKITFYMGDGEIQYDFMPIVSPLSLVMEGIPVSFGGYSDEKAAMCSLIGRDCFIMKDNELFAVEYERNEPGLLLIIPNRACRDRYVYWERENRVHVETPALCKSFEGSYYFDKLWAAGLAFDAIDEITLERYAHIEDGLITLPFGYYKMMYVCPGCVFCGKCSDATRVAVDAGILINTSEIVSMLSKEEEDV